MFEITEIYYHDGDEVLGEGTSSGRRLYFENEGDSVLCYELTEEEWALVDTPPASEENFADLRALRMAVGSRGCVCEVPAKDLDFLSH